MAATSREQARADLRTALLTWRSAGIAQPVVPVYAEIEGESLVPQFFGLTASGDVEEVAADEVVRTAEGHWERR